MSTVFEIIDTAVKIGLGALITGSVTFLNTKSTHKYELRKNNRDECKQLVREFALNIEMLESHINDCIVESGEGAFSKAKASLVKVCNEAYSARSIANLIGSDELVEISDKICSTVEGIYPILATDRDKLFNKIEEVSKLKKTSYKHIREVFQSIE